MKQRQGTGFVLLEEIDAAGQGSRCYKLLPPATTVTPSPVDVTASGCSMAVVEVGSEKCKLPVWEEGRGRVCRTQVS